MRKTKGGMPVPKLKTDNRKMYMVFDRVTGMYVRKDGALVESPVKLRGHREATRAVFSLLRDSDFAAREEIVVLPWKAYPARVVDFCGLHDRVDSKDVFSF